MKSDRPWIVAGFTTGHPRRRYLSLAVALDAALASAASVTVTHATRTGTLRFEEGWAVLSDASPADEARWREAVEMTGRYFADSTCDTCDMPARECGHHGDERPDRAAELPPRVRAAEERRAFRELIEASSLGTPGAAALRKTGRGEPLTAEEQRAADAEVAEVTRALGPRRKRGNSS